MKSLKPTKAKFLAGKGRGLSCEREDIMQTETIATSKSYDEDTYLKIEVWRLILFGIYSVLSKGETCTFERLIAECFINFPKVFCFKRYPQWPDSLKFDRPLRTLREKGLIVGGAGGKYSPGEFSLTDFGEKIAKDTKAILDRKAVLSQTKKPSHERSIDDKWITHLKNSIPFKNFLNSPENFSISETELRNLLRCTLETPIRILKQNLEYSKNLAKSYSEKGLLNFLLLCEKSVLKKGKQKCPKN